MVRRSVTLFFLWTIAAFATRGLLCPALAENWPQWRGPHGDGSSQTADPPLNWSEDTNIRWKVELPGRGGSTPIIWGDRLYVLSSLQTRAQFGEASSPALHDDKLVIPWDHEGQSSLIALDANTGKTLWKVDRDEQTTWATPLITPWKENWQVVTNGKTVRSYALETGELLWEAGGQVENPIPTPIRYKDFVIAMTGYRGNAIHAIELDAMGDVTGSDYVRWSRSDAAPYVASPALYDGRLYFTKSNRGLFVAVDASSGESVIPEQRLPDIGTIYASPVAAKDRIYVSGREGTTVVLRHAPTMEVLATNRLDDVLDASPALVGDLIYLRGEKHLYCIGDASAE